MIDNTEQRKHVLLQRASAATGSMGMNPTVPLLSNKPQQCFPTPNICQNKCQYISLHSQKDTESRCLLTVTSSLNPTPFGDPYP